MNVCGFSQSCKCMIIFDGKKDCFSSLPAFVKKSFANTTAIRQFMQITEPGCKVYAIMLENYESKGPHTYEISLNGRLRTGFGKGTVKYIKPTSNISAATMSSFFKTDTTAPTPDVS